MKDIRLVVGALSVLIATGFGQSSKDETPQKHRINYHGQITTLKGKTSAIDNISISNKYRSIKMYEKPIDPSHDPSENITSFDLDQIYSLEPAPKGTCNTNDYHYKNKHYTEIVVTLRDQEKTQQHYLIESTQKIMCDVITGAGPLPKELSFNAIKKLVIKGSTERDYHQLYPKTTEGKHTISEEKQ